MRAPETCRDMGEALAEVLAAPGTREWRHLTDCLAHVHAIGGYPSHTRVKTTRLMAAATSLAPGAGLDGRGSVRVRDEVARALDLETHPMIRTLRRMEVRGFRIVRPGFPHAGRRRYDRILMQRANGVRIHVQSDGSILGDVID